MNREELNHMLSIVDEALRKILLAERTIDGRRRNKAIREAKKESQDLVYPYKAILTNICHKEYLNDELFDWGHLESDLRDVIIILTELNNKSK